MVLFAQKWFQEDEKMKPRDWDSLRTNSEIHNTPLQTHNLLLALFLSKVGQNVKEVRICHHWLKINYFRFDFAFNYWNISGYCWRSEFIIVRSLRWEKITQLIISNVVLLLIRIIYSFESGMLGHHRLDKSKYGSGKAITFVNTRRLIRSIYSMPYFLLLLINRKT